MCSVMTLKEAVLGTKPHMMRQEPSIEPKCTEQPHLVLVLHKEPIEFCFYEWVGVINLRGEEALYVEPYG
jgi:hypothetical protein